MFIAKGSIWSTSVMQSVIESIISLENHPPLLFNKFPMKPLTEILQQTLKYENYVSLLWNATRFQVLQVTRFFRIISHRGEGNFLESVSRLDESRGSTNTVVTAFQRENNEICRIIGRQFIAAEWFLLRLTTAVIGGAYESSKEDNLPWGDGPFFHSPSLFVPPASPLHLPLVLPPILRIYFLSADPSLSFSPLYRPNYAACDTIPPPSPFLAFLPLSPLFRLLSITFGASSFHRRLIRPVICPRPPPSISPVEPNGVQVGSRRKRNRRRVDFRSANVISLLMNSSVR